MPNGKVFRRDFNSFHVSYGITNPSGKDLTRIDFFDGDTKVGQALLGDAIAPAMQLLLARLLHYMVIRKSTFSSR